MTMWEANFDPAKALARIISCVQDCITTVARGNSPAMLLEAVTQTCGIHARWRHDFMAHVQVACLEDIRLCQDAGDSVAAKLVAHTSRAMCYAVQAPFLAMPARVTLSITPLSQPQNLFQYRFQCLHSSTTCTAASRFSKPATLAGRH